MRSKQPLRKPMNFIEARQGKFRRIQQRLEFHRQLLNEVRASLTDDLGDQCVSCVVNQKHLIVYVNAAPWAAQIRFQLKNILYRINSRFDCHLEKFSVRVCVSSFEPLEKSQRKARIPEPKMGANLRSLSEDIVDDSLRQSLRRLSFTLEKLHQKRAL